MKTKAFQKLLHLQGVVFLQLQTNQTVCGFGVRREMTNFRYGIRRHQCARRYRRTDDIAAGRGKTAMAAQGESCQKTVLFAKCDPDHRYALIALISTLV